MSSASSLRMLRSPGSHSHHSDSPMHRRRSSEFDPSRPNGHLAPPGRSVVAIKGVSSCARAEDFGEDKLLSGDVVEQVSVGGVDLKAPFAGGKTGLQRELRRLYSSGQTLLQVMVKRGGGKTATVRASITPDDSSVLRKQYVLKSLSDSGHVVIFTDSTEEECTALQEMRCGRIVSQLSNTPLTDLYVPYSWEEKMKQVLPVGSSSMVYTMLVIPHATDRAVSVYNNVEDTVNRAMAWFTAAQASGVPINFLNIQTEPVLTKVSGQQASSRTVSSNSRDDVCATSNAGIYGFEDYHGIDIGILRAVRLWYVPNAAEISVFLKADGAETRLGVGISRTEEGFCHVSSVEEGTAADRAGLRKLLHGARAAGKLLVVARVADEKITPWLVSSGGGIRCFDTNSISHKFSVHRQAGIPVRLHVIAWDDVVLEEGWTTLPQPAETGECSHTVFPLSDSGSFSGGNSSSVGDTDFSFSISSATEVRSHGLLN